MEIKKISQEKLKEITLRIIKAVEDYPDLGFEDKFTKLKEYENKLITKLNKYKKLLFEINILENEINEKIDKMENKNKNNLKILKHKGK